MITNDDINLLLFTSLELVLLGFIIYRLIVFISSFMLSVVQSIRNKSIVYDTAYLSKPDLVPTLDKKTLIDKGDVY